MAAAATHNVKSSDRPPSHLSTVPPPCCDDDIPGSGPCGVLDVVVGVVGGGVAQCRLHSSTPAESRVVAQRHTHSPVAADCDRGATCYCVTQGWSQHTSTPLHHLLPCCVQSSNTEESTLSAAKTLLLVVQSACECPIPLSPAPQALFLQPPGSTENFQPPGSTDAV